VNVTVQVPELADFQTAIVRYIREIRQDSKAVMRRQGRLLLREAMHLTPPRTRGEGRKLVKAEVLRSVRPLKASEFVDRRLRKLVRARDHVRLQSALDELTEGPLAGKRVVPFGPSLHQDSRNARGRVPAKHEPVLTLDHEALAAYIRGAQDRVGRAKRGWAAGVLALGGTVPGWVSGGPRTGDFVDRLDNPIFAYLRADNESEWARRGDDDRVLARAMSGRAKAILGDIERKLARSAEESFA
jgi:hypothetical protein